MKNYLKQIGDKKEIEDVAKKQLPSIQVDAGVRRRFDELNIGTEFIWKDIKWVKLSFENALADGYGASNYFKDELMVTEVIK